MKKPGLYILLLFTGMLAAFTIGFYIGRNANNKEITISFPESTYSAETTEAPETTVVTTISPAMTPDGKIDLNLATMDDLIDLPGIGEGLATLILNYRDSHGPFTAVDELSNVSGIGEKKLEAISDFVTVVP